MNGTNEQEVFSSDCPFYVPLTSAAWRRFIKYGQYQSGYRTKDRIDKTCMTLFLTLDQSDRDLLTFVGNRTEPNSYVLIGYAKETGISREEVKTRFNWLNYKLAVKAGLINKLYWIEPPQHHITNKEMKGKKNNEQQD